MRLAFGDYVFDSETRELQGGGRLRHLPPKAFRLLEVLLECRPKALSKSELHDRLWPKTFVSASNLGRLVADLRAALGDAGGKSALIRTVRGFGYAFSGAVADLAGPVLSVVIGGAGTIVVALITAWLSPALRRYGPLGGHESARGL